MSASTDARTMLEKFNVSERDLALVREAGNHLRP